MVLKCEEALDTPVDVWRRELNVEPGRQEQTSSYEVLTNLELEDVAGERPRFVQPAR